jgi:hypothetical protein
MNNTNSPNQYETAISSTEGEVDWMKLSIWVGVIASCSVFWYSLVRVLL